MYGVDGMETSEYEEFPYHYALIIVDENFDIYYMKFNTQITILPREAGRIAKKFFKRTAESYFFKQ